METIQSSLVFIAVVGVAIAAGIGVVAGVLLAADKATNFDDSEQDGAPDKS